MALQPYRLGCPVTGARSEFPNSEALGREKSMEVVRIWKRKGRRAPGFHQMDALKESSQTRSISEPQPTSLLPLTSVWALGILSIACA